MTQQRMVKIYGDSLMRGTIIDENSRYRATIGQWLTQLSHKFNLKFDNRAHFGITIHKGQRILEEDIRRGLGCDYALLEFGGNDCSFNWQEVDREPCKEHLPATDPEEFSQRLMVMALQVKQNGAVPVLMTLPPIDAQRHFDFISRNNSGKGIAEWLGDTQMIYRFHELYSSAVIHVANVTSSLLVDVRSAFLASSSMPSLVGQDGVHPSPKGYALISRVFDDFISKRRKAQPALA